jgi:CP family cyanate transporter-like MFS transporter
MNKRIALFLTAMALTAISLRGPIASVGSLIESMEPDLGVSKGYLGFITTLPLLVFAASSVVIPKFANKMGHTRILTLGMILLAIGCVGRVFAGYYVVLMGTLLVGVGISVGNVLLPAVIKENMPLKIGIATALYMCFQSTAATAGAGVSYPMAVSADLGWRAVLAMWAIPAALAAMAWIAFARRNEGHSPALRNKSEMRISNGETLWKSKLAWFITIIMGVQSVNYYCITAWLPSILEDTGMSFQTAGYVASAFQLFSLPATFAAPIIIAHTHNKIMPAVMSGVFYLIGILVLMVTSNIAVILIGLFALASGGGASFAWVVAMIAVVSKDSNEATRLSGMSQSIGYLMAAVAPTLAGFLFDMTGGWMSVMLLITVTSLLIIFFSIATGRVLKGEDTPIKSGTAE